MTKSDSVIDMAGGFGRFQILASVIFTLVFITNGHLFYAIPFLVMFPKYMDNKTHTDYCHDKLGVSVNWGDPWSLENWVDRFNLECVEPYKIGLLGSMYFVGTTVFGILVTRIGDLSGR